MSSTQQNQIISVEQYLNDEPKREKRHELINGKLHARTDASINHQRICGNFICLFGNHLEATKCDTFGSNMKVNVDSNFFYPDVAVDCSFDEQTPYYSKTPIIIVEVLSGSTARIDRTIKRLSYINIASLKEYVLIEQDFVYVEVMRKNDEWAKRNKSEGRSFSSSEVEEWTSDRRSSHYFLGDEVYFESIDLTLSVADIYARVNNEDMTVYFR